MACGLGLGAALVPPAEPLCDKRRRAAGGIWWGYVRRGQEKKRPWGRGGSLGR